MTEEKKLLIRLKEAGEKIRPVGDLEGFISESPENKEWASALEELCNFTEKLKSKNP